MNILLKSLALYFMFVYACFILSPGPKMCFNCVIDLSASWRIFIG